MSGAAPTDVVNTIVPQAIASSADAANSSVYDGTTNNLNLFRYLGTSAEEIHPVKVAFS